MLDEFALLASLFSVVIAIFAIIIILLLKKNITDILNKDVILFDKNFDIKKRAIDKSFELLDELNHAGYSLINNAEFKAKATACYNELLCVISNIKLVDEFYSLAISGEKLLDNNIIERYKLACRKDIGFKIKGSAALNTISRVDKQKAEMKKLIEKNNQNAVKTISEQPKINEQPKIEQEKTIITNNANPAQAQSTNVRPNAQTTTSIQPNITQQHNIQQQPNVQANIQQPNINRPVNAQPNPTIVRPTQNVNPTTNIISKPVPQPTQNPPKSAENVKLEEKHRGRPRKS